jgi:predicted O-methyltransferase YrrM
MSESPYVLARGDSGAERLRLLARVLDRTTTSLLARAGLAPGQRCLDVGCAVGAVTIAMARVVGPGGLAVGIDADANYIELARRDAAANGVSAVFRQADARALESESGYDLVYARFLLSHVADPAQVVGQLVAAARPGGSVVVEDVDFTGHFAYPRSDVFARYVALYQAVVRSRGADPDLGPRLPELFDNAGVESVELDVLAPAFRDGAGKPLARATLEGIRQAVVAAGLATDAEVDSIVAGLAACERDRRSILSAPRIFQVWGRRGGAADSRRPSHV